MSDGPQPTLKEELDSLIDRYSESEVAAAFKARTRKPLGRPPEDDLLHLLEMARLIAIAAPSRSWRSTRTRTVFDREISWVAKEVGLNTPRYDKTRRKDVAKTLRQKFKKVLRTPTTLAELMIQVAILRRLILGERCRWAPYDYLPEGAAILAELDAMQAETDRAWCTLEHLVMEKNSLDLTPIAVATGDA